MRSRPPRRPRGAQVQVLFVQQPAGLSTPEAEHWAGKVCSLLGAGWGVQGDGPRRRSALSQLCPGGGSLPTKVISSPETCEELISQPRVSYVVSSQVGYR